jgi:DNA-binding MarR family transcriptional regulator
MVDKRTPPTPVRSSLLGEGPAVAREATPDFGWSLGVIFRGYVSAATTALADLPGGPRGYQVLDAAARLYPRTQMTLAQQLGIDRTVMTYLLDDLEKAGLIERRPAPNDRRARQIVATEQGRALLVELDGRLRLAEEHILSTLASGEREAFRDMVRRLGRHVQAFDPNKGGACQVVQDIAAVVESGSNC